MHVSSTSSCLPNVYDVHRAQNIVEWVISERYGCYCIFALFSYYFAYFTENINIHIMSELRLALRFVPS